MNRYSRRTAHEEVNSPLAKAVTFYCAHDIDYKPLYWTATIKQTIENMIFIFYILVNVKHTK